jgi:hypothetical protein
MAIDQDSDRHAQIQILHKAARLERAQTLRRLVSAVMRRRGTAETWAPGQPVFGEGR